MLWVSGFFRFALTASVRNLPNTRFLVLEIACMAVRLARLECPICVPSSNMSAAFWRVLQDSGVFCFNANIVGNDTFKSRRLLPKAKAQPR